MRRREFITLVGGAAAAWPVAARAQPERKRLIGFVGGISEEELRPQIEAFKGQLQAHGWIERTTFALDVRATGGDFARLETDAVELVAAKADLIVALGTPGVKAVQRHTRSIPIVFMSVSDPVGQGLIDSLAHPGGNATGLTNFEFAIGSKWIELLKEVDQKISRVTLLSNPANPNTIPFSKVIWSASQAMGIEVNSASVKNAEDIKLAFSSVGDNVGGSVIVLPDSLPFVYRTLILELASKHRVPTIYPFKEFSAVGGLMSYGLDQRDVYRQAATYVDKILRGAKPAELPVQAPNKFELAINLRTARALGLAVPLTLQASADEVIE